MRSGSSRRHGRDRGSSSDCDAGIREQDQPDRRLPARLWLADIAAGAAALAQAGDHAYWPELAAALTVEKFPLG